MHKSTQNQKNTIFFVWSFGEFAVGPICTPGVAAFSLQSTAKIGDLGGPTGSVRRDARRDDKCSSTDLLCGGRGVHQRTGPLCFFQAWHLHRRGAQGEEICSLVCFGGNWNLLEGFLDSAWSFYRNLVVVCCGNLHTCHVFGGGQGVHFCHVRGDTCFATAETDEQEWCD